ncbi:ABC family ABC transporter [Perilla frutescens var. hirtella]|uniref:ABC family ABC transporter n=1 Tax=Perilla frutescens var. hirtella TaxID=608512 RepID=A0AAD4P7D1_PERFH|nr:ABC family ABC transporter [Perilla frutescens var. hirtella]KAH6828477.1 ABC family ABC transporter [Perilla frutescens var. hirtella]
MADYRSKSYSDGKMQIEPYTRPSNFRSYSVSYTSSYNHAAPAPAPPPQKLKKGKSSNGSMSKSWSFNDPEFQRKRRVASYKVYSVEGKLKGSVRKSVRWLKCRYTQMVYGWW